MKPYYEDAAVRLFVGDAREALSVLPDESVQCCVTSPPYWGLRDYGVEGQIGLESSPDEYVDELVAVFREVRRVLRADGTLWLNLGDSYTSTAQGTENAPERIAGAGGRNGERGLARARYRPFTGLKPKDLVGIPWRVAFALQADGWWLRSDIIWSKPNPMPESVTDRPTKAHEYVFLLSKSERYYYDDAAIREDDKGTDHPRHILHEPEPSGGLLPKHSGIRTAAGRNGAGRNRRTVWTITTKPYPEAHFATFPPELPETCIKAGTKPGDTVLDPFAGAGTTLYVAKELGRKAVGVELNPTYADLIKKRVAQHVLALAPIHTESGNG